MGTAGVHRVSVSNGSVRLGLSPGAWRVVVALAMLASASFPALAEQGGVDATSSKLMSRPLILAQAAKASPAASPTASPAQALETLIRAAKAEGEVFFYSAAVDSTAKRTGDAFFAKYGIKSSFIRIGGTQILQRFETEAEAGTFAADLVLNSGDVVNFTEEGIKKGWHESISQAGLPVLVSGEYPARLNRGPTAVVQIAPWILAYNTDKLKPADLPKDWNELLSPRFKGQLVVPAPRSSDAYIAFWALHLDKLGDQYFTQLRSQGPRLYNGIAPSLNALAAGEGSLMVPTLAAFVQDMIAKGAPLKLYTLDNTTGIEMQVLLTSRAKAKHPNAARLFANYILSQEGNKVFNDDPGGVTVYDTAGLPKGYQPPKAGIFSRRDEIAKLFGT